MKYDLKTSSKVSIQYLLTTLLSLVLLMPNIGSAANENKTTKNSKVATPSTVTLAKAKGSDNKKSKIQKKKITKKSKKKSKKSKRTTASLYYQPTPRNPYGVVEDGADLVFSIRSSTAERVQLLIFKESLNEEPLNGEHILEKSGADLWSIRIPKSKIKADNGGKEFVYYGYRFWGPNWRYDKNWAPGKLDGRISDVDDDGNRFNPNKVLFDPYAMEISHDPMNATHQTNYEFSTKYDREGGVDYRAYDTAKIAPKGIYYFGFKYPIFEKKILRPLKDEIIYEAHLRGLTKGNMELPEAQRGTYLGATKVIPYLKSLGVTAIEFLPIHETQNDQNDVNPKSADGDQYWGYMTLNFFSPDRRYSSDKSPGGPTREFINMIREFKKADIKVYLDVVYNHTAEGSLWDNDVNVTQLYSFRGIDNGAYYLLGDDRKHYYDLSGTGNSLNTTSKISVDLVIDSLKHWRDLGVDGFRFDLAAVLGNNKDAGGYEFNSLNEDGILIRTKELPGRISSLTQELEGVDLIAEPWAAVSGSYKLGEFPFPWAEWNGQYRDNLRTVMNKLGTEEDNVTIGMLSHGIGGSSALFGSSEPSEFARGPYHSINFVTAHDGFTLRDLFSYNHQINNLDWPNGPSPGGEDHNRSWDQSISSKEQQKDDQLKAVKNALTYLLLSAGTPMILGGDENYRTQLGNNNAYNVDSPMNWLKWGKDLPVEASEIFLFTQKLIALRKELGALRRFGFFEGRPDHLMGVQDLSQGRPDIDWIKADGTHITNGKQGTRNEYHDMGKSRAFGYILNATKNPDERKYNTVVVFFNFNGDDVGLRLPAGLDLSKSYIYASTSSTIPEGPLSGSSSEQSSNRSYVMKARSSFVLTELLK